MNDLTAWLLTLLRETCAAGKVSPEEFARRLAVTLAPGYLDYAEAEPRPAGILQFLVGLDGLGGPVRFVRALLDPAVAVRLTDLETVLRNPRPQPTLHPGDPERIAYDLSASGPAGRCAVTVDLSAPEANAPRLVESLTVVP